MNIIGGKLRYMVLVIIVAGVAVAARVLHSQPATPPSTAAAVSTTTSGNQNQMASGSSGQMMNQTYRDGTYTGSVADAYYGNVQVKATISGGKITDVAFLQYPSDQSHSQAINSYAMPQLKQEAVNAQSATVDIVSGATDTSQAFQQSLGDALATAKT